MKSRWETMPKFFFLLFRSGARNLAFYNISILRFLTPTPCIPGIRRADCRGLLPGKCVGIRNDILCYYDTVS